MSVVRRAILEAAREFNAGRFFEAHEAIEEVLDDTPDGLRKRAKDHQAIRLRVMDVDPSQILEVCETLPSVDRVEISGKDGDLLIFPKPGSVELLTELQQLLSEKAWQVARLQQLEGQLDEVFRRVTMGDAP